MLVINAARTLKNVTGSIDQEITLSHSSNKSYTTKYHVQSRFSNSSSLLMFNDMKYSLDFILYFFSL